MEAGKVSESLEKQVVAWYEALHRYPELGLQETKTSGLIRKALQEMDGMLVSRPTPTGVMAVLRGGRPGRTIAFRADIDALPVQEQTGSPNASAVPGVMHACGHDGHVAMLLGAAKLLSEKRQELCGELRFLFQPAEEIAAGACEMISAGVLEGVDEVYGAHLDVLHPAGTFGVREGPLMASTYTLSIRIHGRGGHAAFPHTAVDSVYIAAQVILALHGMMSRSVNAFHRAVLTIPQVQASGASNVMAETVTLGGTVRVLDPACEEMIFPQIEQVARGICQANGADCTVEWKCGCPALCNPTAEYRFVCGVLEDRFGGGCVYEDEPVMGGENFSEFLKVLPSCYYKVGAAPADGKGFPHHNPQFHFDPAALRYGVEACAAVLEAAAAR